MNHEEELRLVCCGREDAMAFLRAWEPYVHVADDILDGHLPASSVLRMLALANQLYSSPFYVANAASLVVTVQLITCVYADSVELAERGEPWADTTADVLRHCGADMVRAVALLCGGYDHLRRISPVLHERGWKAHHDREGRPT